MYMVRARSLNESLVSLQIEPVVRPVVSEQLASVASDVLSFRGQALDTLYEQLLELEVSCCNSCSLWFSVFCYFCYFCNFCNYQLSIINYIYYFNKLDFEDEFSGVNKQRRHCTRSFDDCAAE